MEALRASTEDSGIDLSHDMYQDKLTGGAPPSSHPSRLPAFEPPYTTSMPMASSQPVPVSKQQLMMGSQHRPQPLKKFNGESGRALFERTSIEHTSNRRAPMPNPTELATGSQPNRQDATSSFGAPGLQYHPQQDSGPAATQFQSKWTPIQSKPTPQPPPTVITTQSDPTKSASVPEGPYVLTFGKHAGKSLNDVPPDYIAWLKKGELIHKNVDLAAAVPPTYLLWLQDFDAPEGHEDLKQALKDHKRAIADLQVSSVQAGTNTSRKKKKAFDLPSDTTFDVRRYYFNGDRKVGQMWIGCNDCVRYFGADAKAMVAAGLRPHHKNQRFWLHQVFAYAKHFGTTKGETPTKALNKFKSKNYNGSFYDSLGISRTMV
ncbi:hypothetical protein LTS02_008472 [Friedmanniomyces endolithicus]|nr:hypothetical protein LTS02_008472 [Friedmanniomyces endolithicus]